MGGQCSQPEHGDSGDHGPNAVPAIPGHVLADAPGELREAASVEFASTALGLAGKVDCLRRRVTGGGRVPDPASADGKANFAFTVRYTNAGNPRGNSIYLFHGPDGYDYLTKSTSWQGGGLSFAGDPSAASFSGRAVVQKVDPTSGAVVESWGNFTFTADLYDGDRASPTQADRYAVTILNPGGAIWHQVGAVGNPIPIGGGNVAVHGGGPGLAAAGGKATGAEAIPLTDAQLRPIVREAVRRWNATGLTAAERRLLRSVTVRLADLGGAALGETDGTAVRIDRDAAGYGWFADPAPREDSEFIKLGDQGEQGRMDLLTAVMHEVGHVLGRDHEPAGLMAEELNAGERKGPASVAAGAVKAGPVANPLKGGWFLSRFYRR